MYRSLNNIPLKQHGILKGYNLIEDGTDDIDFPEDYNRFKRKLEACMETKYLLNLIIPCHNLENYIQPCLDSICKQKNKRRIGRKVIFVCDNCTDNTEKIIRETMKNSL